MSRDKNEKSGVAKQAPDFQRKTQAHVARPGDAMKFIFY
jgi:hypothetical protein